MSQEPKSTLNSTPLTADALAALFELLTGCEPTMQTMDEARAILAKFVVADLDGDAQATARRP
jgi:hypothetical protein